MKRKGQIPAVGHYLPSGWSCMAWPCARWGQLRRGTRADSTERSSYLNFSPRALFRKRHGQGFQPFWGRQPQNVWNLPALPSLSSPPQWVDMCVWGVWLSRPLTLDSCIVKPNRIRLTKHTGNRVLAGLPRLRSNSWWTAPTCVSIFTGALIPFTSHKQPVACGCWTNCLTKKDGRHQGESRRKQPST